MYNALIYLVTLPVANAFADVYPCSPWIERLLARHFVAKARLDLGATRSRANRKRRMLIATLRVLDDHR